LKQLTEKLNKDLSVLTDYQERQKANLHAQIERERVQFVDRINLRLAVLKQKVYMTSIAFVIALFNLIHLCLLIRSMRRRRSLKEPGRSNFPNYTTNNPPNWEHFLPMEISANGTLAQTTATVVLDKGPRGKV
jgi:hypothetical protein